MHSSRPKDIDVTHGVDLKKATTDHGAELDYVGTHPWREVVAASSESTVALTSNRRWIPSDWSARTSLFADDQYAIIW